MYNAYNKKAAIRTVKEYLYVVSETLHPEISRTTIDGIYDEDTKKSVAEFQNLKFVEPSGEVNYETFTLLYKDYKSAKEDFIIADYIIEDSGFPIARGDMSEDVRVIHILIKELSKTHTNITGVGTGNYYSNNTAKVIEELRKLFMMPSGNHVDKELYTRMKKEVNAQRSATKKIDAN